MPHGRFDIWLGVKVAQMVPAEQRLAHTIALLKDRAVLASAVPIADPAGTSDTTLLRMMRAMGYETLAKLHEDLLADIADGALPSARMPLTIEEAGTDPGRRLAHVTAIQQDPGQVLAHLPWL